MWSGDEWGVGSGVISGAVLIWGATAILSLHSEKKQQQYFGIKGQLSNNNFISLYKSCPRNNFQKKTFFHHKNNAGNFFEKILHLWTNHSLDFFLVYTFSTSLFGVLRFRLDRAWALPLRLTYSLTECDSVPV